MRDHDALFRRLHVALRPGGRLVAQCGGHGNITELRAASAEVAHREPYAPFFVGWEPPWHYATAEDTERRLTAAGFQDVRAWSQPWEVDPPEPATYLRSICLHPHVQQLPADLAGPFIADVLVALPTPLVLATCA